MKYVVGVDCSTSAVKTAVFDKTGAQIALTSFPLAMSEPQTGWHEQNAEDWSATMFLCLKALGSEVDMREIGALAVTCQRETLVLVDKDDVPVRPAILWLDMRSSSQVKRFGSAGVHALTGKPPAIVNGVYKLIWLSENEPESLEKTETVYDVSGYLMHKLTGERATCFATADTLSVMNIETGEYSQELLACANLCKDLFPRTVPTMEIVGRVTAAASALSGLSVGTPVVSTVGDGQAAAVGMKVVHGDIAYLSLGTGIALGASTETYSYDLAYRTLVGYKSETYYLESLMANGSYLVSWFIRKFDIKGDEATGLSAEQILEAEAHQVPEGCDGLFFLPYMNGCMTPHWDDDARGAFIGLRGSHGRGAMYRAILEGVAYEINLCLRAVERARGHPIEAIVAMGGGAKSDLWCQIIADITGRNIQLCEQTEVAALGAAMHAAAAIGLCGSNSIEETAQAMSRLGKFWQPCAESHARYAKHFIIYEVLYPALRDVFRRISAMCNG